MATTTHHRIIQAVEVWNSDDESTALRPTDTIANVDASISKQVVERVVSELAPVVLNREDVSQSNGHGEVFGFHAVMGIPVIVDKKVKSCVVVAIGCSDDAMSAFEIWSRDDRDELGLNGAVFAGLGRFASISQHVKFPRGSGLPGQSWEDREAKLITGLGTSPNFMRAAGARAGGLDVGIALPIMSTEHNLNSVILLLSSLTTPIARAFEIWDIGEETATYRTGANVGNSEMTEEAKETTYTKGEGIVGRVWYTGLALAKDDLASLDDKRLDSMQEADLTSVVAIPTFVGTQLKSVFVMFN